MTWRVVHVSQSEKMRLKLDNLLVQKMGQEFTVPLSDISIIVAEGGDTVVTLRLLSALSKYNIALVVCDNEHLPTGIYHSQNGHFRAYKRLKEQLDWSQKQKDKAWQIVTYYSSSSVASSTSKSMVRFGRSITISSPSSIKAIFPPSAASGDT